MKSLIKIALISLPMFLAAPLVAQVSWGVGIQFGTPPPPREVIIEQPPPPREVIVERPSADGIWVPGYYHTIGYRREWTPGFWRHPHGWVAPERHYGYGYERGREFAERGREFRRDGRREEFHRDGGREEDRRGGRDDNGRHQGGRIR